MRIFLLFILFFPISFLSFADNSAIIEKIEETIDPSGELHELKTKIVIGTVTMPDQDIKAEVKTYYKRPDKYRIDTIFTDEYKEVRSYDGSKVMRWTSTSDKLENITGLDRKSFILNVHMENPNLGENLASVFASYEIDKNNCFVNDKECIKIAGKLKDIYGFKENINLYIGVKENLILKMDIPVSIMQKEITQEIFIDEYKPFSDILFPTVIKSSILGAHIDYSVTEIKINEPINDSIFTEIKE